MPDNTQQGKKRGRPPKNKQNVQSNITSDSFNDTSLPPPKKNEFEFNSFMTTEDRIRCVFGFDVFRYYTPEKISDMVANPMANNESLRKLSNRFYSSSGLYTQCVDYCTSMPTLDHVIIPKGKNKNKRQKNKELMVAALNKIRHKEVARDNLLKDMIDGIAFYYFEVTEARNSLKRTLSDYDVESIVELNELGVNASIIPLPTDYTRVVGRQNSSPVLAFNLRYFEGLSQNELNRKLRLYPKEIRDGYNKFRDRTSTDKDNWLILNNNNTICTKVRSKMEERWGRPLCLAAIKNILYGDYFTDTCRNTLNEQNNRIVYQTLPEGKEKGSCALTKSQQEAQHEKVKGAVLSKNQRNRTSFFTVAAGTKIDSIENNLDILDEKNSSYINDQIGLDLGFMANLLVGSGSGSYAAQQNNLQLLLSEVMMWLEQWTNELVKVINENIIKDKKNPVGLYYLPCSHITRSEFTQNMKELYMQGKGSLRMWISSTGIDSDAYLTLMDLELEENWEDKYPVHKTSYTMSNKDNDNTGGRPSISDGEATNENTIVSKANNSNGVVRS